MAKYQDKNEWVDNVYTVDVFTPVLGGKTAWQGEQPVSGYSNASIEQLADRTHYLREAIETLERVLGVKTDGIMLGKNNLSELTDIMEAKYRLELNLVDNVRDLDKPVSNPTRVELNKKADKATLILGNDGLAGGGDLSANRNIGLSQATKNSLLLADNSVQKETKVIAGNGMTGGGSLSGDVTLNLGTPSETSVTSTNSSSGSSHTHALSAGVKDSLTKADNAAPLTYTNTELGKKADKTISISAGTGLTGGGNLSANRTVSLGTPSTVTGATTNSLTATSHTHAISITKDDVGLSNVSNDLQAKASTTVTGTGALTGGGSLAANRTIDASAATKASLALADSAVQPSRSVNTGTGLTGGGNLSTNRTIALNADSIASLAKADAAAPLSYTNTELDKKVDKVVGKQLSTEDYTTAEKNKLAGIATGATKNATDAQLRDRTTHTGVQPINTVTGLQDALDSKVNLTDSRLTNSREWTASVVSQSEAEAGVSTTARKWTSQRVRQAITSWWNTIGTAFGKSLLNSGDATGAKSTLGLHSVATTGSYNDLTNKPSIPTIPSVMSQAEASAGTSTTQRTINAKVLVDTISAAVSGGVSADALIKANNLSDVPNKATARSNLGLSDAATTTVAAIRSGTTAANVGLGNVLNVASYSKTESDARYYTQSTANSRYAYKAGSASQDFSAKDATVTKLKFGTNAEMAYNASSKTIDFIFA